MICFDGQVLENGYPLGHYKVKDHSTLTLVRTAEAGHVAQADMNAEVIPYGDLSAQRTPGRHDRRVHRNEFLMGAWLADPDTTAADRR